MTHPLDSYYESICEECLEIISKEDLFSRFDSLSQEQLNIFINEFYVIVREFPKQLGLLIYRAPSKHMLFTLVDNMMDELGGIDKIENYDYSGLHTALLEKLGQANGLTEEDFENMQPSEQTQIFQDFLVDGYVNKPFVEAVAYIAAGMEAIFPVIAKLIYKGLSSKFTDEQLIHFKEHMTADVEHDKKLRSSIYPMLEGSEENKALFRKGALECAEQERLLIKSFAGRMFQ